jgi:putative MATE family efflux protein|tara:strand:- start:1322 stop:2611 length:1290 start_codon:yes stop_codon:yes gene_type:complete
MLWKLGFPNIIAWLAWTISTFADAFFVGILGTNTLASIALIFPFQMLMLMMAGGAIGGGVTSSIGRAIGNKDVIKAESSAWCSLIICLIMALIYTIIFIFFSRDIFSFMGGSGEALEGAINYAKIFFGFSIFVWLVNILSAIIRGLGDTLTPAKAITVGSLFQILLSAVLTLGFSFIPSFGVMGPAIALIFCHAGMVVYLLFYLFFVQRIITVKVKQISIDIFKDIMKVGGLGLLNSITIALTVAVVTGYVGNYGVKALAGYGLGARLELMLTPIIFGLGAALTASVSINIGSNKFNRARKIAWTGGLISFILIGLIGTIFSIFPMLWLDNFTSDADVLYFSIKYLNIVAPFYCLFGLGQALYFASQGTGKMIKPIIVGLFRFFSVITIGYISLIFNMTIDYIFFAVSIGLVITGIGMSLCLKGSEWRK